MNIKNLILFSLAVVSVTISAGWFDLFWSRKAPPKHAKQTLQGERKLPSAPQPAPAPEAVSLQREFSNAIKKGVAAAAADQKRREEQLAAIAKEREELRIAAEQAWERRRLEDERLRAEQQEWLMADQQELLAAIAQGAREAEEDELRKNAVGQVKTLITREHITALQAEVDRRRSEIGNAQNLISKDQEQLRVLEAQTSALRESLLSSSPENFDELRSQIAENEERWRSVAKNLQKRRELVENLNMQLQTAQKQKDAASEQLKQQWLETAAAAKSYVGTIVSDAQALAGTTIPYLQSAGQWIREKAQARANSALESAAKIQSWQDAIEQREQENSQVRADSAPESAKEVGSWKNAVKQRMQEVSQARVDSALGDAAEIQHLQDAIKQRMQTVAQARANSALEDAADIQRLQDAIKQRMQTVAQARANSALEDAKRIKSWQDAIEKRMRGSVKPSLADSAPSQAPSPSQDSPLSIPSTGFVAAKRALEARNKSAL